MGKCVPLIYLMSALLMVAFYGIRGAAQKTPQDHKEKDAHPEGQGAESDVTTRRESEEFAGNLSSIWQLFAKLCKAIIENTGMSLPAFATGLNSEYRIGEYTGVIKWNRQRSGGSRSESFGDAVKSPEAAEHHSTDRKAEENRVIPSHKAMWDRVVKRGDRLECNTRADTGWKRERDEGAPLASDGSECGLRTVAKDPCIHIDLSVAIMPTALVLAIFTCCWKRKSRHQRDEHNAAAGEESNEMWWSPCCGTRDGQTDDQGSSPKQPIQVQPSPTNSTENGDKEAKHLHKNALRKEIEKMTFASSGGEEKLDIRSPDDGYIDLCFLPISNDQLFIGQELDKSTPNDLHVGIPPLFRSRGVDEGSITNITVVCGAVGTGKSTMVKKIIHDWATEKKYTEFEFVFCLKCQKLNAITDRTNFNSLLIDTYPHLESALEHVWKEPKKVMVILEDLDSFRETAILPKVDGKSGGHSQGLQPVSLCSVPDIVRSLIRGEMARGCSLLITSRPWRLETLRKVTVDLTFQMVGFTSEQVHEYFVHHYGDGQEVGDVMRLLVSSPTLRSMFCNPLFCSLLVPLQGEEPRQIPTVNYTRVISAYVTVLLEKCGYDVETSRYSLANLGEMAHKGITGKKYTFATKELNDIIYYLPNFTSAFLVQVPNTETSNVHYTFTFPVVQDFIAALGNSLNTPGMGLKGLLDQAFNVIDDRFNMFSRFLVGLSSRRSTAQLEESLGQFPSDASSTISKWLAQIIPARLCNLDIGRNQKLFLNALHCLLEVGDGDLMTETLASIKKMKFNQCRLLYSDCVVLSLTLVNLELIEELDLNSCGVQDQGLQQIHPVLHKCRILRLKSNQLTDACLESLCSALCTNRSLTEVDLSNTERDGNWNNRFTDTALQEFVDRCDPRKKIRWIRVHDSEAELGPSETDATTDTLTVKTD